MMAIGVIVGNGRVFKKLPDVHGHAISEESEKVFNGSTFE
jgi:hypothetical protein